MKSKFMIVAACIATLTAVPASAQLLGGGGGGGLLGGSIGGVGGSLGGTLGGSGSGGIGLDRSIDLDNGRVGGERIGQWPGRWQCQRFTDPPGQEPQRQRVGFGQRIGGWQSGGRHAGYQRCAQCRGQCA